MTQQYLLESNRSVLFPRFFITVGSDDDKQYWNGSEWTDDLSNKLLYTDPDAAIADIQRFRVEDFEPKATLTFEIPLTIEVSVKDQGIDIEDLKAYLKKAMGFYLDVNTHGDGPNNSLVVPSLLMERMRKV